MSIAEAFIRVMALITLAYFAGLNGLYVVFAGIASRSLGDYLHRQRYHALDEVFAYPFTPAVTILLPAFNEAAGIVQSVRSLLLLRYPRYEIIIVNDGSTDATLDVLQEAFDFVPACRAMRSTLRTKPIRGCYVSSRHQKLWVIDKEKGGKADALNAGINAAAHEYFCAIDADSVVEKDALLQVAAPIIDDPEHIVATGGIVRIANGCTIDHGQVTDVRLPSGRVAVLQVIEYFRAFLIGRVAWTRLNALLIISGAFGLFRRSIVEEAGGYWRRTVGEDTELVVRMHRYLRKRRVPYRMVFVAEPVCWTEVPHDLKTLARQRRRWHRGFGQTLWRHRTMLGNPRYGMLGLLVMPYFLIFEFCGPVVEVAGPVATVIAFAIGELSVAFFAVFLVISLLLGIGLSVAALMLEEFSFRRHQATKDVIRMLGWSVVENIGYRQLTDMWRVIGILDLLRGKRGWGRQTRRGIGKSAVPIGPEPSES